MNRTSAGPNRDLAIDYDLMNYINDTISAAIENAVQESVDQELTMMIRGEGFKKRVQNLIDARLQSLVSEIAIKTSGAGPGRGHKGRSDKKCNFKVSKMLLIVCRSTVKTHPTIRRAKCLRPGAVKQLRKFISSIPNGCVNLRLHMGVTPFSISVLE